MQRLMGLMRRAIEKYDMIQSGDSITIGVSGGKDSVALMVALARLQKYIGIDYKLYAVTLDPMFGGIPTDYSPIENLCKELNIPYIVKRTEIGHIIFDIRKESNPCSLCARMRRGCLHDITKELGCNKIALGHHYDDVVETFFMNLFNEGRIGCFQPVTYLSRKDLTMIRPMLLAEETLISSIARRESLPIVKSSCPVDGHTNREWTKEWLSKMGDEHKGFKKKIYGAIERGHISGF